MANIIDKFMDFMKLGYDEYDENEEDELMEMEEPEEKKAGFFKKNPKNNTEKEIKAKAPKKEAKASRDFAVKNEKPTAGLNKNVSLLKSGKDVNMNGIYTIKPMNDSDKRIIGTKLIEGKTVFINLEGLESDIAQRVVDFTSGVCYAINGDMKYPSKYFVVAAPDQVELDGTYEGENSASAEPSFNGMTFDKFQY